MGHDTPRRVIRTEYTCVNVDDRTFCAPDIAYQNGAVIINEKDEVLVLKHIESEKSMLPRFIEEESLEKLIKAPLQFVHDQTGLVVERLPLVKPFKQYQNLDVKEWRDLEPQLCCESTTTTSPFLVALDVAWFQNHQRPPGQQLDGRQSFINWYSGIVRGDQVTHDKPIRKDYRFSFMPLEDALTRLSDEDYVAEPALLLFDVLWKATKDLRPSMDY